MNKRIVVVGGATVLAGLVLGASIYFGPAAGRRSTPTLPTNIQAPGVTEPNDNPGEFNVKVTGFDYTTFEVGDDGQLRGVRIQAKNTSIKPMGITGLTKPRAEIRLGSQRAILITADKADMFMEDSKPREGTFSGNVVVTLLQAPDGTALSIEPDDPAQQHFVQQRIYLDQATEFSIEDDTINTAGPVHLTSPQVDFYGIGLRLAYNTQRQRIEQLVIDKGKYLIYNPDAKAAGFSTEPQKENDDKPGNDKPAGDKPATPSQFYAVDFFDNVVIRDGLTSELAGQTMTLDFSLGTEVVKPRPIKRDNAPAAGRLPRFITLPNERLAQANAAGGQTPVLPVVEIPKENAARSLLSHDPKRDIVVTWDGRMQVYPHAEKPQALADDKDVRLTLAGPQAYAQTTRNGKLERLETSRLEYLRSKERVTAFARDDGSARILSVAMGGEVAGQQIILRQKESTATVVGPGKLTYTSPKDNKQLVIDWKDRLDLELYSEAPQEKSVATNNDSDVNRKYGQTRIVGVKSATFDGEVTARHTDFDLDAGKLTIAFARPDKSRDIESTPTAINATGGVKVLARGDAEDERFDISAKRLSIDLSLDAQREPYASAIRALDGVSVKRPGSQITCNRIEVELNAPERDKAASAEKSDKNKEKPYAQVRNILAIGDVRASLDYEGREVDLVADELIGDVERDRLTLSSSNRLKPAEVFDRINQRRLTGKLVIMDDQAKELTISGPGSLATRIDDRNKPDASIEDAFLSIAWADAMKFNNVTGQAEFEGKVRSESRRSTDASEMLCDTLSMLFSPDYEYDPARLVDDPGKDNHNRQVRYAVATGEVKFSASAWEPEDAEKITNRMRLEGPRMVFTNKPAVSLGSKPVETLVVQGKGRMVLEDYRKPDGDKPDTSKANAAGNNRSAAMTGRGATLFTWNDSMSLDALTNTATLLESVQMVHIAKDEKGNAGEPVQLDCSRLLADMADTGGLSVWMRNDAPDAKVTLITADDNVRILQANRRSMSSDHLKFEAATNLVELWSDDERNVAIEDLVRDVTSLTNKLTWDLTTDRIEIDKLKGGAAPVN